jgi:hypothetical protein
MAETIAISLGGRDFTVRPLTFRQLREIEEALGRALKAGPLTKIDFDAAIDIVAAALNRADPTITRDTILDLEGTKTEIVAATRAILGLSGYVERETASASEAAQGEE